MGVAKGWIKIEGMNGLHVGAGGQRVVCMKGVSLLLLWTNATSIVRTTIAVYNTAGRRHLEHSVFPSMQSSLAPYVCAADSQNACVHHW